MNYARIREIASRARRFQLSEAGDAYHRYLVYSGFNPKNQSGASNKFWEIDYKDGIVKTRWGKVGSAGQTKTQGGSIYTAKSMAAKKTAKGYQDKTPASKKAPKVKKKAAPLKKAVAASVEKPLPPPPTKLSLRDWVRSRQLAKTAGNR